MARRLSRRELLLTGAHLGAGLALAACGRSALGQSGAIEDAIGSDSAYDGPKVKLDYWNGFTGGDGPVMLAMLEGFMKEHANIEVAMNLIRWDDYYQKVPAAVYAGRGPDVGIMHIDQLATYAAQDVIVPLDPVTESLGLEEADFSAPVWQGGISEGKRYGIPLDVHPLGFYYNKTVMKDAGLDPESPPATRDEYMIALQEMKSKGIQGGWVSPFLFTGGFMFQSLLWQFGGELYNPEGTEAQFASPAGVDALEWMVGLVEQGYSPEAVGQDADIAGFFNGQNAFNWNGPWMVGAYGSDPALKWGVAPLPQIGDQRAAWGNSHNFVIMNQREPDPNRLEASRTFVGWMSENSLTWADAGMVPARRQVRDDPKYKKLVENAQFAEELDYVHFPPPVAGITDAQDAVVRAVNQAVLLTTEPEEALAHQARIANDLLAENRDRYEG
jgi:multiple sugar transport system substrate-binding protein